MIRKVRFVGGAADGIEINPEELGDTWPPYTLQTFAGDEYKRAARPKTEDGAEVWEFHTVAWTTVDERRQG